MKAPSKSDDTSAVLEKIHKMREPYREMGLRLHELILESEPSLVPRVWYGMPGYAKSKSSPVICYFRADTYMTFGLTEKAHFDFDKNGPAKMCPTAWFFTELNNETEKKISEIIKLGSG